MREAFETQNTPMLHESFAELPPAEASEIFRRVVDSGLWVPSGGGAGVGALVGPGAGADWGMLHLVGGPLLTLTWHR